MQKKYPERKKNATVSSLPEERFQPGKLLACIAPRPGRCGPAEGHVLEGKELEFCLRNIKASKGQETLLPPVLAHAIKAFTVLKKKKKSRYSQEKLH